MNLLDWMKDVIKTEDNTIYDPAQSHLFDSLNVPEHLSFATDEAKFKTRVSEYWLKCWYCTDSWVGYTTLYFDGEPIAFTEQEGRKCDKIYNYVSKEKAAALRNWIYECVKEDTPSFPIISEENLMQEQPDALVTVAYGEQLFKQDYEGYVDGRRVTVISKASRLSDRGTIFQDHLLVRFHDTNKKRVVPTGDYKFPLRINAAKLK